MIMTEKRRGASDREREERKHGGERNRMHRRAEASMRTDRYK